MSWNIFFGWLIIAKKLLLQHNQHFYRDVSVSIRDLHQKKLFNNSSSGSCHDSDATWQEIGRTCGSACSMLPSSRFKDWRPSFRICTASLIHLVLLSDSLSKILIKSSNSLPFDVCSIILKHKISISFPRYRHVHARIKVHGHTLIWPRMITVYTCTVAMVSNTLSTTYQ